MRTPFELCNQALGHLGMRKISTLEGTDPSAVACNTFFEPARDDVFRECEWSFASVQQPLNQSIITAPLGWDYAYDYPTDNIATVWTVFDEATADDKYAQDFEVLYIPETGAKIIGSNLAGAYAGVTYIVTDSLVWDPKFDLMLSFKLAALICPSLTGDSDKALKVMDVYNMMLAETKRLNASEKMKKPKQNSQYIDGR